MCCYGLEVIREAQILLVSERQLSESLTLIYSYITGELGDSLGKV